jgi:hypothetical protein
MSDSLPGSVNGDRNNETDDERDPGCERCGSSTTWVDCYDCGGEGTYECHEYPLSGLGLEVDRTSVSAESERHSEGFVLRRG